MHELVKVILSTIFLFYSFSHSSAIFKFSIVSMHYFITWKTTGFRKKIPLLSWL